MQYTNVINIDTLIERINRVLTPSIKVNRNDVVEYVYDAYRLIGLKQPEEYYIIKNITDYKVELPQWIENVENVYYIPDNFTLEEIENNIQEFINRATPMSLSSSIIRDRETKDYKYLIRNKTITTNKDKGWLIVIYNALPTDENGEPIIYDEINVIEALKWFIVKEEMWKATIRNPNQYSALFQKAEQEWKYYSIQAKTASIFPYNEDKLKQLRNKYMRMLPKLKS